MLVEPTKMQSMKQLKLKKKKGYYLRILSNNAFKIRTNRS